MTREYNRLCYLVMIRVFEFIVGEPCEKAGTLSVLDKGRGTRDEESAFPNRINCSFILSRTFWKNPKIHGIQNVITILKRTKVVREGEAKF